MNLSFLTWRIPVVALLYGLLGGVGLALALPPSYASPLFPAAGLALSMVLWQGRPMLVATWLGSLCMELVLYGITGEMGPGNVLLALGMATGATLQAWLGSALVRRFLGTRWQNLVYEKDVFLFLVSGGALACVISASFGTSGLYLRGLVPAAGFFHAWWTWYVGDVMGVLVFAPLTLMALSRWGALWTERRRRILAPMLLTLALVAGSFYAASYWEEAAMRRHVQDQGQTLENQLHDRIVANQAILTALGRFVEVTPDLTYARFEKFTRALLEGNLDLMALSFNAHVSQAERAGFEARMGGSDGGFQITERDSHQRLVRAVPRPEYVPITYIAPLARNRAAEGFDINSEPVRREALIRARASGHSTISAPIQLVQDTRNGMGFLVMTPVYSEAGLGDKGARRFLGVVVAVTKIDEMVVLALRQPIPSGMVFHIVDRAAPPDQQVLYRSDGGKALPSQRYLWQTRVEMGDRQWDLLVFPTQTYLEEHRPWVAWSVGVAGLLFAGLLQMLMLGMTGRAELVQRRVDEQTAEIKAKGLALEESEERYRRLFDDSRVPMLLLDPLDGCIADANQAAAAYYGYPRAELKGKPLAALDAGSSADEVAEMARAGKADSLNFAHRLAGGEVRQVEVRSGPIEIHGRRLFYTIILDVTERKRLEAEIKAHRERLESLVVERTAQLSASEAHTRLILESTADGLFGLDPAGCVTFINPAACRLLGLRAERVVGHHVAELARLGLAGLSGGGIAAGDEVFHHADGHTFPVIYASHPMLKGAQAVGTVVSFVDITGRKALEEAREAARQEAERLARVKSEFLANMSHEIRTPLNGVLGMAQVGYRASHGRKAQQTFGRIIESGRVLLAIINDILDFTKIEAGKMLIEHLPFQPAQLLHRLQDLLAEKAQARGIQLCIEKSPDLADTCLGDPLRIEQILLNLISNAIKFTEHGSVRLWAGQQGNRLIFRVSDTGIGMSQEQMTRIFSAFEQADGSTTRKFGGTGLGLTISRRLGELMHGNIRVESEAGVGSVFELSLPLELAARDLAEPHKLSLLSGASFAGLRVLAVEDNEINQLVMEDMLMNEGAEVLMANNGQEAVDIIRREGASAFNIVLMDIQMPEMDGLEATRQILQLAPGLPIVGQTAHALVEEKQKCIAAGMVDHLAKPIELDELVAIVLKHARA